MVRSKSFLGSAGARVALGWATLLVALAASGCQPAEHSILLRVYAQEDVQSLRVILVSLDTPERWVQPERSIRRSVDQIQAEPIRVAITLGGPRYVMVHLVATTPDGERLVATRCYAVGSVIQDDVLLVGPIGELDLDGDTWVADPSAVCREPGPDPRSSRSCDADPYVCPADRAADCNDADPRIHPGAPTICRNGVDEDCDGMDEDCGDQDGDGWDACSMNPAGPCDCDDNNPSVNPDAVEICNDGIDQNCTGADLCCDNDGDMVPACVDGLPDCDDNNPLVYPGAPERCDGVDNNCNGQIDELDECRGPDLDGDGVPACGREAPGAICDCNDCDRGISPLARERCGPRVDPAVPGNGIDEDCDGRIDEGCPADDLDGDGVEAGRDCDDTDPLIFPPNAGREPIDRCGDGIPSNCIPGEDTSCDLDRDRDGYSEPPECEDDPLITPGRPELCNGYDDDCDGVQDEVLSLDNSIGCLGGATVEFASAFTHCGGCRVSCDAQTASRCLDGRCDCEWNPSGGACETSDTCCSGIGCRDLQNDPQNCGLCGFACGQGELCMAGRCVCGATGAETGQTACPEPDGGSALEANICCGGRCQDVRTDPNNCGQCGLSCGPRSTCGDRRCVCDAPAAGERWEDCNGDLPTVGNDGCEVNTLGSDVNRCGSCLTVCSGGQASWRCTTGMCEPSSCDDGFQNCDAVASNGCETNISTSLLHCGVCGRACAMGETCMSRMCRNVCGNGVRTAGEACDDGNTNNGDGCSSTCTLETGWSCSTATPNVCTPVCGDGVRRGAETCDDMNTMSGDGCSSTCRLEMGWTCNTATPNVCTPICGDGLRRGAETCDDRNTVGGDGCSSTCQVEMGWTCNTATPNVCTPICGDGLRRGAETCDDMNTMSGDGCSTTCQLEMGWTCNTATPNVCTPFCGDGLRRGSETCDDMNTISGDGCSATCQLETGWTCNTATPNVCTPFCGDGLRRGSETCDDMNTISGDGCSATCQLEMGWTCNTATPNVCTPFCGDGLRRGSETCDDMNTVGGDGCSATCQVETGWTCNTATPNVCTRNCGNGMLQTGEACDDGNGVANDGCSPTCQVEEGWTCTTTSPSTCATICGDGLVRGSESCDDDYTDACGTCNATCTGPGTGATCGDGVVCPELETCDDRNTDPCGTCNETCTGAGSGATCPGGMGCRSNADCMSNNCTGANTCGGG